MRRAGATLAVAQAGCGAVPGRRASMPRGSRRDGQWAATGGARV